MRLLSGTPPPRRNILPIPAPCRTCVPAGRPSSHAQALQSCQDLSSELSGLASAHDHWLLAGVVQLMVPVLLQVLQQGNVLLLLLATGSVAMLLLPAGRLG